jgi:hypothetical protein
VTQVAHKRSPDEPEGGWLGPRGPNGWPDLEVLDRKQRGLPEQPALHEFLPRE